MQHHVQGSFPREKSKTIRTNRHCQSAVRPADIHQARDQVHQDWVATGTVNSFATFLMAVAFSMHAMYAGLLGGGAPGVVVVVFAGKRPDRICSPLRIRRILLLFY
jgi:hypothetical protein